MSIKWWRRMYRQRRNVVRNFVGLRVWIWRLGVHMGRHWWVGMVCCTSFRYHQLCALTVFIDRDYDPALFEGAIPINDSKCISDGLLNLQLIFTTKLWICTQTSLLWTRGGKGRNLRTSASLLSLRTRTQRSFRYILKKGSGCAHSETLPTVWLVSIRSVFRSSSVRKSRETGYEYHSGFFYKVHVPSVPNFFELISLASWLNYPEHNKIRGIPYNDDK